MTLADIEQTVGMDIAKPHTLLGDIIILKQDVNGDDFMSAFDRHNLIIEVYTGLLFYIHIFLNVCFMPYYFVQIIYNCSVYV